MQNIHGLEQEIHISDTNTEEVLDNHLDSMKNDDLKVESENTVESLDTIEDLHSKERESVGQTTERDDHILNLCNICLGTPTLRKTQSNLDISK